jgi:hypothetical protein
MLVHVRLIVLGPALFWRTVVTCLGVAAELAEHQGFSYFTAR